MTMNERRRGTLLLLVAVLTTSTVSAVDAQRPTSPPPSGNRIVAQDGDVVVVENDARVSIVRRREASVRAVFDGAERWLLLLVDHAGPGGSADGRVDFTYYYTDVAGAWPFETPWEGVATIEEYSMVARGNTGVGIATPGGLVQLLQSQQEFRDANAVAILTYSGGGSSGISGDLRFDEAERWYTAELRRNDGVMRSPAGASSSVSMSFGASSSNSSGLGGPVRVGGNIRPPVKIVDVPPVRPEMAVRANVRGVVVLEVTVDVDGTVKDARVLRSLPLLDAAAIEAVRQWRYEPTTVGGKPVPVIITVPVEF
jgi:TonB family protein